VAVTKFSVEVTDPTASMVSTVTYVRETVSEDMESPVAVPFVEIFYSHSSMLFSSMMALPHRLASLKTS
jgi:hypothetical protein